MQERAEEFYLALGEVAIAHEWRFSAGRGCDYSHGRGVFGISYALSGSAEYRFPSGEVCRVCAGTLAFLPADAAYVVEVAESYRHYTVNFGVFPEACRGEGLRELLAAPMLRVLTPRNPAAYERAFERIVSVWSDKRPGFRMLAAAGVYELMTEFLTELLLPGDDAGAYDRLLPAKKWLDAYPTRETSLAALAEMCGMSETSFRRGFREVFGLPPLSYRDSLRAAFAADLLLCKFYTVEEVARECGFPDANYFSRFFRRHLGVSPREYRATH